MEDVLKLPIDISTLAPGIRADIESFYFENGRELPDEMTVYEALNAYLFWHGILGWTENIAEIIRGGQQA